MSNPYVGIKAFAGPRGSGRTTALINWVREDERRRFVALDKYRADFVQRIAPDIRVWCLGDVNTRNLSDYFIALGVDDYDQMIHANPVHNLGLRIRAIAFESEDYINITPRHLCKSQDQVEAELNTILNITQP